MIISYTYLEFSFFWNSPFFNYAVKINFTAYLLVGGQIWKLFYWLESCYCLSGKVFLIEMHN